MTTFYLVRHGETESNARHRLMGRHDAPLTARGIAQAKAVAAALKGKAIAAIYSSPLGRAQRTAKVIATTLKLFDPITFEPLEERSYGSFEEKPSANFTEAMKAEPAIERTIAEVQMKVESDATVSARVRTALETIAVTHPNKTVVIVTHSAVLRGFLQAMGVLDPKELIDGGLPNGTIVVLHYSPKQGFKYVRTDKIVGKDEKTD